MSKFTDEMLDKLSNQPDTDKTVTHGRFVVYRDGATHPNRKIKVTKGTVPDQLSGIFTSDYDAFLALEAYVNSEEHLKVPVNKALNLKQEAESKAQAEAQAEAQRLTALAAQLTNKTKGLF